MEPIRRGHAGPEVADVQMRLGALGHVSDGDDPGVFGPHTERAVRGFQQARGLAADGVVGDDTWRSIVEAGFALGDRMLYLTRPLLRGDDIRDLQRRLSQLGFTTGYADGLYGQQTFEAVREFQRNVGIEDDGIAGRTTIDMVLRLHRTHQEAPAFAVREREQLRAGGRSTIGGARLMVDAGHGPDDPGWLGPQGVPEHEVTWAIANRVTGRLSALGAHVVLGRGPGVTPNSSDRARLANREDVEAIISIHCNGYDSQQASGAAAYFYGAERWISERGRRLADLILERLVAATGTLDCRSHASTAALLRESRAPAVIVEAGHLTHPDEGRRLLEPDYQRAVADAIVDAIVTYLVGLPTPILA